MDGDNFGAPQASAKTFPEGIICIKPRSWGLATLSKFKSLAPGICFWRNSAFAFRGELGMCQLASRMEREEGSDT